jgi:hypothetical protein
MEKRYLRIIYIGEFLLALIAVFTLWSQVGQQTHLDLMAWYFKLFFGVGMAFAAVRATAAAAEGARAWNRRSLSWMAVLTVLAIGAGLITYYYHLNEPADQQDEEQPTETSITPAARHGRGIPFRPRRSAT